MAPLTGCTLSSSSMIATSVLPNVGNGAASAKGFGDTPGKAVGRRSETRMRDSAGSPMLPAPSTARTFERRFRAGLEVQIAQVHPDFFARFTGQGDQVTRHVFAVHGDEEAGSSRRAFVLRRGPGNPRFAGGQIADLGRDSGRSGRRRFVLGAKVNGQIWSICGPGFPAVDESVGKMMQRVLFALPGPFRAGVVEEQEPVTDAGDAGRHHGRIDGYALPALGIRHGSVGHSPERSPLAEHDGAQVAAGDGPEFVGMAFAIERRTAFCGA